MQICILIPKQQDHFHLNSVSCKEVFIFSEPPETVNATLKAALRSVQSYNFFWDFFIPILNKLFFLVISIIKFPLYASYHTIWLKAKFTFT